MDCLGQKSQSSSKKILTFPSQSFPGASGSLAPERWLLAVACAPNSSGCADSRRPWPPSVSALGASRDAGRVSTRRETSGQRAKCAAAAGGYEGLGEYAAGCRSQVPGQANSCRGPARPFHSTLEASAYLLVTHAQVRRDARRASTLLGGKQACLDLVSSVSVHICGAAYVPQPLTYHIANPQRFHAEGG